MNNNITSANASLILIVDELFPQGIKVEQFSTDAAASENEETFAETRMGVDGKMVAGYVDEVKSITLTLEPSSPTIEYLDTLMSAMRSNKKIYFTTLLISLPAIGKNITCSRGVLKTGKQLPDLKKVLDPISFTFDFERVER